MKAFLNFLYHKPFFGMCFIFQLIPFWVFLLAIFTGADALTMILLSLLSVFSRAYVDSEISFKGTLSTMASYIFAKPFFFAARLMITALLLWVLIAYGTSGVALDAGIAAVMIVFVVKLMYFRPAKNTYWNITGLRMYRFYSYAGRLLAGLMWLALITLDMGIYDSAAVMLTALFLSVLTFYKTNEGLL